ncbi:MAG: hypothetical protein P1U63_10940 [Coxiellaceae bacterium]|nr:hypothetical protein [Coxiellaceae bacterium]
MRTTITPSAAAAYLCIALASKYTLQQSDPLQFFSPEIERKSTKDESLLVVKFYIQNLLSTKPIVLKITDLGVQECLRGKGLMTRTTINALLKIYQSYGDIEVTTSAVHIATALLFTTSDDDRATVLALHEAMGSEFEMSCKKSLAALLTYHCERLSIPFIPAGHSFRLFTVPTPAPKPATPLLKNEPHNPASARP